MNLNDKRAEPKRNAHATKKGPGRRHDKDPTVRADKQEGLRGEPGAKLLRKARAKTLGVPHP